MKTLAEDLALIAHKAKNELRPNVEEETKWTFNNLMTIALSSAECGLSKVETLIVYPKTITSALAKNAINTNLIDMLDENGFKYPCIIEQNGDTKIVFHFEE